MAPKKRRLMLGVSNPIETQAQKRHRPSIYPPLQSRPKNHKINILTLLR